jgi:hypothetical protein
VSFSIREIAGSIAMLEACTTDSLCQSSRELLIFLLLHVVSAQSSTRTVINSVSSSTSGKHSSVLSKLESTNLFQVNKVEAALAPDEGDAAALRRVAQLHSQTVVIAHLHQRQGERHATEGGLGMEHVAEQNATPKIDPPHGPAFASDGDHGGRMVKKKPAAVPGSFHREVLLRRRHRQHPSGPGRGIRVEHVELELMNGAGEIQRGDGVVATRPRKEADVGVVEVGVRAPQQLERRVGGVGTVDEVVEVLVVQGRGAGPHVEAEEEEVVHRVDDARGQGRVDVGAVREERGRPRRAPEEEKHLDELPVPGAGRGRGAAAAAVDADDGLGVEEDVRGVPGPSTRAAAGGRSRGRIVGGHGFGWNGGGGRRPWWLGALVDHLP